MYHGKVILSGLACCNTNICFRHNPELVDNLITGVIETAKSQSSESWEHALDFVESMGGTEEDIVYITYFPDLWK